MWSVVGTIWILAAFTTSVVFSEMKFVLSQNMGTWSESDSACTSIRGSLAVLDNIELQRSFDRDVKPNQGEGVWVGRYVGYTPIVTIEGCYRNQTLPKLRTKPLVNNYLVTCLRECKDTPFIGMQGTMCYCVPNLPQQTQVVPGMYCATRCPGEAQTSSTGTRMSGCGMSDPTVNTVSVYRKVNSNEINIDKSVTNVGECFGYNVKTSLWQPVDCSLPKLFTCRIKPCNGPPQGCVLESNVPSTWSQARDKCESSNAVLSTVNLTTSSFFNTKPLLPDPLYWTGLHRKEVVSWSYDKDAGVSEYSDRCFVAVKQPRGNWQLVVDWCKNRHRYACVQDLRSTVAPVTQAPTKPPSTLGPVTSQNTSPVPTSSVSTTANLPTVNPNARAIPVTSSAPTIFISPLFSNMGQCMLLAISSFVTFKVRFLYI